jgi:hypothetical protein
MATAVTSSDRLVLADVVPFLLTGALKLAIAALVLPGAWTLVRRMR